MMKDLKITKMKKKNKMTSMFRIVRVGNGEIVSFVKGSQYSYRYKVSDDLYDTPKPRATTIKGSPYEVIE